MNNQLRFLEERGKREERQDTLVLLYEGEQF
jgi:hypothetical protein